MSLAAAEDEQPIKLPALDEDNSPSSPVAGGYSARLEAARAMYWWNRQQPGSPTAEWEELSAHTKADWFEKAGEYIEQRRAA